MSSSLALASPPPPTRPALRYLGGKFKLAAKIVRRLPDHRQYLEPFGGAASVLLAKPRAHAEIYNDLDGELVNLFRVLRSRGDEAELVRQLRLTPFAYEEFRAAYVVTDEPIERARRLVVRSFQGFGSNPTRFTPRTGFRSVLSNSGTTPARDWANYPNSLEAIIERLQGVCIESRPALDLIGRFDRPDTVIFADPPYVHATRPSLVKRGQASDGYTHEMTDAEHCALLDALDASSAMVVLCGYANAIYDDRLSSWARVDLSAHADGGRARIETLWLNRAAAAASPVQVML